MIRSRLAAPLVVAIALAGAPAAHADVTARLDGSTLVVDGTAGRDTVEISAVTGELRIASTQGVGQTITAGSGCRRVGDEVVGCPRTAVARARVTLLASDDTFAVRDTAGDLPVTVRGGDGGDQLLGGNAGDSLFGDDGVDVISGAAGNDALNGGDRDDSLAGGSDNDNLDGGSGGDRIDGGAGTDTADYSTRSDSVVVSIDGEAGDGRAFTSLTPDGELVVHSRLEGDNVLTTVENVTGGSGHDGLGGSAQPNRLNGLGGDDTLRGHGGDDQLIGSLGGDLLDGGDGSDLADYSDHTTAVQVRIGRAGGGGQGDGPRGDTVATERVRGGSAGDQLHSFAGNVPQSLDGGPGNDFLVDENSAAGVTFIGGTGTDLVTYARSAAPVSASMDGVANDGPAGDTDNVRPDVENLEGGDHADVLRGSASANRLDGGPGDDTVEGSGGADLLIGSPGTDAFDGGSAVDAISYAGQPEAITVSFDGVANDGPAGENDQVTNVEDAFGGHGDDVLVGNAVANRLEGGPGADRIDAGAGDDRVSTVDGVADQVACGDGADVASLDLPDLPLKAVDCEQTTRGARDQHPLLRIRAERLEDGVVRVRLHCPRGARRGACRGILSVRRGGRLVARRRYDVRRGRRETLTLARMRPGRHELEARGRDRRGRPLTSTLRTRVR